MRKINGTMQAAALALRSAKFFRVLPKVLFLAAALFSLAAFFSCENSSDSPSPAILQGAASGQNASNPSPAKAKGGEQCVTFRGSVRTGGALPASYAKALEGLGFGGTEESVEGISKSARPDVTVNGTSIEHFAVATPNSGEPVEGTFASASSTTFEMPLAIGKTWNIVCGIRNVSGDKKIIMSDSFQMEVTVSNSVLSHVFTLTPYTETTVEGAAPTGDVALTVNFEGSAASDGASISASWEDPALPALEVEGLATAIIKASGVPVGNHRLAIFFRDSNGVSVYESVQVVTVLNGLTTNSWVSETGEAAILSSGHFVVDDDVIKGAASDRIYVGKPAALASNDSVRASDSNSGSAYSPLEHLQAAFNKIQSAGSGSKDFKIFVSGEVEGTATLGAAVRKDVNARSVTIEGLDGPDESEKPKSVLNGLKEGSVVTVASNVPVTIKNLQITNGRSSAGGGGISMASGSKVTLGKGALIGKPTDQAIMDYNNCGNSGNKGGGILVNGASLVLESGSSVQGNYGSGGLEVGSGGGGISVINGGSLVIGEGAEVCKNASSGPGGGIFVGDNSSVAVNGGIVNQNKASNNGGGFYLDAAAAAAPARLELNGGQINQNAAIGEQYKGVAKGGGIYAYKNGQIQIKGGQINKNTAGKEDTSSASGHTYGAGVYIRASTAQMTNGEISENEGYAVRDSDRHCGSAVAVMEDAEFSISGGTISKNKIERGVKLGAIYVKSEKKTVEGSDVVVKGTFKISGSPSIPYDSGDNAQNYVYLEAEDSRSGIPDYAKERIYSPIKVGNLTGGSVAASVCAQNWLRGKQVLLADGVSDLTPLKDKLSFTEAGISFAVPTADVTKANLMSPFYVSDTGSADTNPGTYDKPYKTFAHAIDEIVNTNAAADYTIRIKGKVSGAQAVVADTITSANCTGLTIEGTTALGDSGLPADSIDRGLSSESAQNDGNALVINTDVPVTIQNLKITGGKITSSADPGAGVSVKKSGADVRLGNGAQVVGNSGANGSNGGGVYVAAGARLFMYGKSLIGDLTETTATGASTAEGANYIFGNGGGIYNLGSVYIGYERLVSGNPLQRDMAEGFGVRRNYSNSYDGGGGIYSKGTLYFNSGSVSYNKGAGIAVDGGNLYIKGGEICANANSYGAGVYLKDGSAEMSGGTIGGSEAKANSATNGGGAVYVNYDKTFKMTGGTISYNKQTGSVGGDGGGGAVYLMMTSGATSTYGTFEMTGGVMENNSAASGNGGAVFNQGILKLSGKASIPYGVATTSGGITTTETGAGKNDVYLYGSAGSSNTRTITAGTFDLNAPETVATISMPADKWTRGRQVLDGSVSDDIAGKFKTIDADFNVKAKSSTEGDIDADIVVAAGGKTGGDAAGARGTYSDPYGSVADAIAYGIDTSHTAITIKGSVGKQEVSSWPSSGGAAGVDSITLKGKDSTAKINAGGTTSAGSALTVNASGKTVTIQDLTITGGTGSDLSGGTAKNGGGIYINAGTVKLTDGAVITGNTVTTNGGGVYLAASGCALYMSGKALIGDSATSTTRAASGASNRANQAGNGAGIYNNGGSVFIGSNTSGTAATGYALVNNDTDGHYGVRRNYSSSNGAGIYHAAGTLKIASGDISCNSGTDYSNGGGIYFAAGASIGGGTFSNGYAKNGGGLYIKSGVEVTLTGGASFTQNEAASTGNGGAVYQGGTFNMSGSAYIAPGSERSNDVYLASGKTVAITGALNPPSGVSSVATISLGSYSRGRDILSSNSANAENLSNAIEKFKLSQDDSGWDRGNNLATTETAKKVWITSPIYVVDATDSGTTRPAGFNKGVTTGANGTKTSPYASVADALTCADLATVKEITIAGTLVGAQQVISSPSVDITLKGYKASEETTSSAKIQRFSTRYTTNKTDGSALKVDASGKNVTITDLTITYGAALSGAGIYIKAGTVKLGDYAKINDNYAANSGGGVYVNTGATLFMYGKALIGDKLSTEAGIKVAGTDGFNDYANRAQQTGGGGIYNWGAAYIGYSGFDTDGTTLIESSIDNGYGIIRNFNTNEGGGAIYNAGTLKIRSGSISYNNGNTGGAIKCTADATISGGTFTANKALSGGAIYVDASKTVTIDGSATFTKNQASDYSGGAIYNAGTLTMSAGTIGEDGALNTAGTSGGAIYQNGTFNISGSAQVYSGTGVGEKQNDVYLSSATKYITVNGTLSGSGKIASVTPSTWTRGTQVLDGTYAATYYESFKCTDTEWSVGYNAGGDWSLTTDLKKRIGADIYVASSLTSGHNRASGISAPSATQSERIGTKAKPYNSISEGVNACWNSGYPFTIKVSGKISGADQTIPAATTTTGRASAITIEGVTGNASDSIDRGLTSAPTSGGSALTISTTTPVTLTKIKITGGYSKTNGGGILVNGLKGASLTLTTGALITANTATKSGGGIYFAGTSATGGTANLIMNDTAKIDGNTASGTGSNEGGGGVYLSYANLCMSGKSVIGDTSGSAAATSASSGHSNTGNYGGGVYAYTGGNVYVGYKTTGTTDNAYTTSCGILHNYSSKGGGGINVSDNAKLYLAYGSISKNGAGDSGGAVTIQTTGSMTMSGGAMALNSGVAGGAVAVVGTFEMTGGTIGNASKSTPATGATACSNYASSSTLGGGAIWAIAGSTVTVTDGTIAYNYASGNGGAIHASGESGKTTTINLGGGSVYANAAVKNGGGVYNGSYSSLFMYSSALIGKVDGVSSAASSATACSNTAVYGGGIYNESGSVYLGYKTTSSTNDLSGGVCYNYATGSDSEVATGGGGGGISSVGGTVLIRAGNVSYNGCVDGGGGLYLKNGSNYKITGGEIKSNKAQTGGGLYVYSGEVSMSGGKFVSNVLTGTAAGNMGGAVFLLPGGPGVFKMSGTAYLPCTGQRENDICFAGNNDGTSKLIVTGKLTLPSGATTTKVARLTGANASRVLFDYTGTDSTFVKEANKFDVSYLSNTSYIIYSDGKLKKGGDATAALTSIEGATGGLTTVVINDSVSTGQLASLKAKMESQAASYPSAYIALDFTMADINSFVFGVKGSASPANLRKVTLPKNCAVADYAFYSCTGLTTVVIPEGTTLSGHSFTKCSSLEELDLSNISASSNLREMCNGCASLREITLPKSFNTSLDSLTRTFKDCTSLTTINYKGTIAEWNSAITNASGFKENVTTTITVKCTNGNTTL